MRRFLKSKDLKYIDNMQDIEAINLEISNLEWELERCIDGSDRRCIREKLSALLTRKDEIEKEEERREAEIRFGNIPPKAPEAYTAPDEEEAEETEDASYGHTEASAEASNNNSSKKGVLSRFSRKSDTVKSFNPKKIENLRMQISELEWKLEHESDENKRSSNLAKLQSKRKKLAKIMEQANLAGDGKDDFGLNKRIERIEKYIVDPYSEEQDDGND
ncbi:hypothetical protein EAL2_808p05180 (plasmid) [Peptoclostridium acidaminophilum DSM 3953]|uniref:Uncharacterized protein n=1 Tax=Peptoclostridium acidaminophilum DSM 3953 TaxID=1286171 RepID=W8UB55_PEPAC|nr:hypothetical protein [Peptoclostridium acidaminophilum]AHM58021.1 hypothetical protein EAL2_808p05180 [Peptoclostridium acidaminophilum DSM 3953]